MKDQLEVSQLFNLDSWILSGKMADSMTLAATRNLLWEQIKKDSTILAAASTSYGICELPVNYLNPRKFRFDMSSTVGPLPATIWPISADSNNIVIHKLVSELNSLHCKGLGE